MLSRQLPRPVESIAISWKYGSRRLLTFVLTCAVFVVASGLMLQTTSSDRYVTSASHTAARVPSNLRQDHSQMRAFS